jgi:hypothetical protein
MLQLQGALALQHLAGAGITAVIIGALALLVDPALLLLARDAVALFSAFALFGAIALFGDPLRNQRLPVVPILARLLLAGSVLKSARVALAARRSLSLLGKGWFAALPFEALLFYALAGSRRTLPFRGALRGQALFRGLSIALLSALDLLPGGIAAFGILPLARLRRTLLPGTLACGFDPVLGCVVTLAGLRGACIRLDYRGMLSWLLRLLVVLARICLVLVLLVVLLLVLVARILARIGRGIEAGGQQGAERDGQQGAVGNDVHGDPRSAAP